MLKKFLAAAALCAAFLSCTPLDDPGDPNPGGGDSTDTAFIQVFNYIELNPGEIHLLQFGPNTTDVEGTFLKRFTQAVPQNQSRTIVVEVGIWKLAIEDAVGDRHPLMEDSGSVAWPAVQVLKDGSYYINLSTDEGNHNIWKTDLRIIP